MAKMRSEEEVRKELNAWIKLSESSTDDYERVMIIMKVDSLRWVLNDGKE